MANRKGTVWDAIGITVILFIFSIITVLSYLTITAIKTAASPQLNTQANNVLTSGVAAVGLLDGMFLFITAGFFMASLIGAFIIRTHPVFAIISFFLLAIIVFLGTIFSNVFWVFINDPAFSGIVNNFPVTIQIWKNYPLFLAAFGTIIIIAMYIKSRDDVGGI